MFLKAVYRLNGNSTFQSIMKSQEKLTFIVQNILKIFGINFLCSKHEYWSIKAMVYIQCCFVLISLFCIPGCYEGYAVFNKVYHFVLSVEIFGPLFNEIMINIEAYSKRNLENDIIEKFMELETIFSTKFDVLLVKETKTSCIKFILKLLILTVVRFLKLKFQGFVFSFSIMFSELVCSVNDFSYLIYVDRLTKLIQIHSQIITPENIKTLDLKQTFDELQKLAKLINQRFHVSLIINIILMLALSVISFYWVYLRAVLKSYEAQGLYEFKFYENLL